MDKGRSICSTIMSSFPRYISPFLMFVIFKKKKKKESVLNVNFYFFFVHRIFSIIFINIYVHRKNYATIIYTRTNINLRTLSINTRKNVITIEFNNCIKRLGRISLMFLRFHKIFNICINR